MDFCLGLPMTDRVLKHASLMNHMMRRLSVTAIAASRLERGASIYEARSRCIACTAETACQAWLEGSNQSPPDFCPNLSFFCAARAQEPTGKPAIT